MLGNLDGLDSLARRDGVDIRPTLIRVLTDLYVQKPVHTAEEERHYTELALRLIDAVDVTTRATAARKLAAYPNAPLAVVRRLARDVIEVAEPVLTQSRVLGDADFAAIIRDFGLAHAAAIARRDEPQALPQAAEAQRAAEAPAAQASADLGLAELFLSAGSAERRVLMMNLADAPATATAFRPALTTVPRLEAAALSRDGKAFAAVLQDTFDIAYGRAQRIIEDASGEPLLVVLKALDMPAVVVQRVLLFLNPTIGHSVQRVFDLAALYERLSTQAAAQIVASLRGREAERPRRGTHQPVYADDERTRGRRGSTARRTSVSETRAPDAKPAAERQRTS